MVGADSFEKYFRAISYLVSLSGLLALFESGAAGILVFTGAVLATVLAWYLEDTRWQLSDRIATTIVILALIGFVLDWRFGFTGIWANGVFAAAGLARLIVLLAIVKLFQKKADKDWIFIYIISFFEILLAAGLSISPLYLATLLIFLLSSACAIVAFELRKSSRLAADRSVQRPDSGIERVKQTEASKNFVYMRLSVVSVFILAAVIIAGLPLFFAFPRGNAAGLGGDLADQVKVTGFSDSVTLGTIGALQQSNAVVMRVRIDQNNNQELKHLLWRGVALDKFDNKNWTNSNPRYRLPFVKNERNLVLLDYPARDGRSTIQTFYLEPLSTNVLFALRRPYAVSGVNIVNRDSEGALLGFRNNYERSSYSVYSDTSTPDETKLREDSAAYDRQYVRYLQLPENLDARIGELAARYVENARAANRYDAAKAIENRLRSDFGYSLEMKAGGDQPVADFLFNIKAGHCEYFASAMVLMLRTQGIAARVVNGFQSGDFNETAGVYVVRQKNAHSWVEVYFPETSTWIAFDPTPPTDATGGGNSFFSAISGYIEALETFWIQYVVAYDGQEQRSVFRSIKESFSGVQNGISEAFAGIQTGIAQFWEDLKAEEAYSANGRAILFSAAIVAGLVFLLLLLRQIYLVVSKYESWRRFVSKWFQKRENSVVEFYERMQNVLAKQGLRRELHQTPLEFAFETELKEAVLITEKYNRVRFGGKGLSRAETEEIERWLTGIESAADNS